MIPIVGTQWPVSCSSSLNLDLSSEIESSYERASTSRLSTGDLDSPSQVLGEAHTSRSCSELVVAPDTVESIPFLRFRLACSFFA